MLGAGVGYYVSDIYTSFSERTLKWKYNFLYNARYEKTNWGEMDGWEKRIDALRTEETSSAREGTGCLSAGR